MGFASNVGKYQLGRTIGEGTFAKVKLALDSTNGKYVAIKILDKHMVMQTNLKNQAYFQTFHFFFFLIYCLGEIKEKQNKLLPKITGPERN